MAEQFVKMTMGVDLTEGIDVAQVNNYFKQMERIVQNLSEDGKALSAAMRKTANSIEKDFYVSKDQAENFKKGFETVRAKAVGVGDAARAHDPFTLSGGQDVQIKTFKQMLDTNAREIAEFKAIVSRLGGTVTNLPSKGMYEVQVPDSEIRPGYTASQHIKTVTRGIRARDRAQANLKNAGMGGGGDGGDGGDGGITPEGDTGGTPKKRPAEMLQSLRRVAEIAIIIKLMHQLVDITKKIFDGMSRLGSQARENVMNSLRLQVSPMDLIKYSRAEQIKGLPQGTVAGALGVVNQKFGSVLNLDTAALGKLAPVMGENVGELVKSALSSGATAPEILNMIMGAFTNRARSGVNSIGENVGTERASRELAVLLQSVLGEQFATMFSAQMMDSMSHDTATSNAARLPALEWIMKNLEAAVNPRGQTNADVRQLEEINTTLKAIEQLWKGIVDGVFKEIAVSLRAMIGGVRNLLRAGMTEGAKEADILAAREENRLKLADARSFRASQSTAMEQAVMASGVPRELRGKFESAAREMAASGTRPVDKDLLRFLDSNPAAMDAFIRASSISGGIGATDDFIKKLEQEIAKRDTGWVQGTAVTESQHGADRALRNFGTSAEILRRGTPSTLTKGGKQHVVVSEFDRSLSNMYGGATSASIGARIEEQSKLAADLAIVSHEAAKLMATLTSTQASRATAAVAVAGEAFVTVQLVDANGRPIATSNVNVGLNAKTGESLSLPIGQVNAGVVAPSRAAPAASPLRRADMNFGE